MTASPGRVAVQRPIPEPGPSLIHEAGITCAAIPFRKTHNLDELAGQVEDGHPELRQLVAPLRWQTSWNFVFRYPRPERTAEPAPTVAELLAVLDDIGRLRAELHDRIAGSGAQ
jgi:hypothetical protein